MNLFDTINLLAYRHSGFSAIIVSLQPLIKSFMGDHGSSGHSHCMRAYFYCSTWLYSYTTYIITNHIVILKSFSTLFSKCLHIRPLQQSFSLVWKAFNPLRNSHDNPQRVLLRRCKSTAVRFLTRLLKFMNANVNKTLDNLVTALEQDSGVFWSRKSKSSQKVWSANFQQKHWIKKRSWSPICLYVRISPNLTYNRYFSQTSFYRIQGDIITFVSA